MNLFDQLNAATNAPRPAEKPTRRGQNKPWKALSSRIEKEYRDLLTGNPMTTGAIAAKRGLTHMGVLTSLYNMEARGVVKRVGVQPRPASMPRGKGQIIWGLCSDAGN